MSTSADWDGSAPTSGTHVIGAIHPPPWFDDYDPRLIKKDGYVLTLEQLEMISVIVKSTPVPVTVEVSMH